MARWVSAMMLAGFGDLWIWLAVTSFSPRPPQLLIAPPLSPIHQATPSAKNPFKAETQAGFLGRLESTRTPDIPEVVVRNPQPGGEA